MGGGGGKEVLMRCYFTVIKGFRILGWIFELGRGKGVGKYKRRGEGRGSGEKKMRKERGRKWTGDGGLGERGS